MFRKIVDVLKEVFWIKPSRKKSKPPARRKKIVKKKTIKKKITTKKVLPKPLKPLKGTAPLKSKGQSPLTQIKKALPAIDPNLVQVGEITHYFDRIKVCVVKITQGTVLIGDRLTILGPKTKFVQKVWSMQIESLDVKVAKKGQLIGLKVEKLVVVGDKVYK